MMVSDARRAANRRNASKSTGPKTDDGKAASRRNALKHGLTSLVVSNEDPRILAERTSDVAEAVKPRSGWDRWLCGEVAGITLQIDRARLAERTLRDVAALRASTVWDDDRRVEVEDLAAKLASNPPKVGRKLRQTPQGCDWLIDRWAILARLAEMAENGSGEGWTSDQRRLAFDFLGTPTDARLDHFEMLDDHGRSTGVIRSEGEVAREAIIDLQAQRDRVTEFDEVDQSLAESGLADDATLELRRLRRYEATLHKRMQWCLERIEKPDPASSSAPIPRPSPQPVDEPRFTAEDRREQDLAYLSRMLESTLLEALEGPLGDSKADPGPTPFDRPRLEAKLRQAESRSSSKRRKLERRRA